MKGMYCVYIYIYVAEQSRGNNKKHVSKSRERFKKETFMVFFFVIYADPSSRRCPLR